MVCKKSPFSEHPVRTFILAFCLSYFSNHDKNQYLTYIQAQREILLDRITRMKAKGTNVNAFMSIFSEIEKLAQADDKAKLTERFEYLSDKVAEQERMLKEAQSNNHIVGRSSRPTSALSSDYRDSGMGTSAPTLPGTLSDALMAAGLGDPSIISTMAKYRMLLTVANKSADVKALDAIILTRNKETILNYMMALQHKK